MTSGHGRAQALTLALAAGSLGCTLQTEGSSAEVAGSSAAVSSTASSTGAGGEGVGGEGIGGAASSSSSAASGGAGATGGAGGSGGRPGGDCQAPDVLDDASGRCYRLFPEKTLYADVPVECQSWHPSGTFAAVSTAVEYAFLAGAFSAETDFWIGGDDLDEDGSWQWQNGETWGEASGWGQPGSAPWKPDEPTGGAGELCLRMKDWLFESKNCDDQAFLCERP